MISVYGHTARTVVTQIGGREGKEGECGKRNSGRSQQQVWAENMKEAGGKINFYTNHICTEDGSRIFIWTVGVHSVSTMNAALSSRAILWPSLCLHGKLQDKLYLYLYHCPVSAGHCAVCSASTCAVPGFASRRAAQVSPITTSCFLWSRPLGESRCGALSEEGTAKHWYRSR